MVIVFAKHLHLEMEVVHGIVATRIIQACTIHSQFVVVALGMARVPVSSILIVLMAIAIPLVDSVQYWSYPNP